MPAFGHAGRPVRAETPAASRAAAQASPDGPRVALMGPFGTGNLGDTAIQESAIAGLRAHGAGAIRTICFHPRAARASHGLPSHLIARPDPPVRGAGDAQPPPARRAGRLAGALRDRWSRLASEVRYLRHVRHVLARVDLLVFSGGGQLDDYWGGPWGQPYAMLSWALMARTRRLPVASFGCGWDGLSSPLSRLFCGIALRLCDRVTFRDSGSQALARALVPRPRPTSVIPDLAFGLPLQLLGASRLPGSGVAIGPIARSAWPGADDETYRHYTGTLASLCDRLDAERTPLRYVTTQPTMDAPAVAAVEARRTDPAGAAPGRTPSTAGLDEVLAEIGACEVVVASRLHSAILGALLERPVVALACTRKLRQLMDDLGLADFCLDAATAEPEAVGTAVHRARRDRAEIAAGLRLRVDRYRADLEPWFGDLVRLGASAAPRRFAALTD